MLAGMDNGIEADYELHFFLYICAKCKRLQASLTIDHQFIEYLYASFLLDITILLWLLYEDDFCLFLSTSLNSVKAYRF